MLIRDIMVPVIPSPKLRENHFTTVTNNRIEYNPHYLSYNRYGVVMIVIDK